MEYQFPHIEHIDQVVPHVERREEFVVAVKDGYTIINYVMMTSDTFRPFTGEDDEGNAIRRECRGITFDNATGEIIRRPFHKFFNAGEREETGLEKLDLAKRHVIMDKLDGSMIAPFITSDGIFRVGTKMGQTDVAQQAARYLEGSESHMNLIYSCLNQGQTPIFEWCSRQQRIVVDHPEDSLILLAIRDIKTGRYLPYE